MGSVFAVLLSAVLVSPVIAIAQHGFSVKQYEEFHEVLHPLEHEALPKGDYRRIRSNSNVLVKHGREIVKYGVPAGTAEDQQAQFKKELDKFDKTLSQFQKHARRGSNAQLKMSYSAVHDSFEMLASMLPRKQ